MAHISQIDIDRDYEKSWRDSMNQLGSNLSSGVEAYQTNRQRAIENRNNALKTAVALEQSGYKPNVNALKSFLKGESDASNVLGERTERHKMEVEQDKLDREVNREYKKAMAKSKNYWSSNTDQDGQAKSINAKFEEWKAKKQYETQLKNAPENKKPTAEERKAATFAERVSQAEKDLNEVESTGFNRADQLTSLQSVLPGALKSEQFKKQDQAERNFVNAILRKESGAAISPTEFSSAEQQYFPRAGDTADVIAQKKRNRDIALAGLRAEAGEKSLGDIKAQLPLRSKPKFIKQGDVTYTLNEETGEYE